MKSLIRLKINKKWWPGWNGPYVAQVEASDGGDKHRLRVFYGGNAETGVVVCEWAVKPEHDYWKMKDWPDRWLVDALYVLYRKYYHKQNRSTEEERYFEAVKELFCGELPSST